MFKLFTNNGLDSTDLHIQSNCIETRIVEIKIYTDNFSSNYNFKVEKENIRSFMEKK